MKDPRGLFRSRVAYIGLAVGVALFAVILHWQGIDDVLGALSQAGWGVLAIALFHLPPLWADAMGWRRLLPAASRPPAAAFVRARWIGESINDLLPVLQMGGNVVKAGLLMRRGVEVGLAGASVVVDVTLVVLSQILFTVLGLFLLAPRLGEAAYLVVLAGSTVMGLLLAGFYAAQRRGFFGFIIRMSRRILGGSDWTAAGQGAAAVDATVLRLYRDRRALIASGLWHAFSWVLGVGEVWFALRLLGHPADLGTALLFESLGQAIRTGAFAVPGALGVQEGGYALVGTVLGIDPPVAVALSLARRVRELILGLPGLAAWQLAGISRGRHEAAAHEPGAGEGARGEGPAAGAGPPRRFVVKRSPIIGAINAGGGILRRAGLGMADLDPEGLIDQARRETGLHDLGDPSFRDPLRRLLESMDSDARLNPLGRLASRYDVLRLLSNRLKVEEDRKRHPEIAGEEVRRPLIITGLPRTGTTLLFNLLALDSGNRALLTWESMHPSPPPETASRRDDPRIRLAGRQIRWFHRMVKDFDRIHPVGSRLPVECLIVQSHSFLTYQFETTHRMPRYLDWLKGQSLLPAYRLHRRFLQHLQWRCPGERWVLKAPAHMFDLKSLFTVYPDACVVMTHRDPVDVAASNASLTATLRAAFSDEVDPFEVGPECSLRWAEAIGRAMTSRDQGCAAPGRFFDLPYRDLVADPPAAARAVYAHFQIPFPPDLDDRLEAFRRQNPKDRFGAHRYTLEEFGLDRGEEERRYAAYRARFGL